MGSKNPFITLLIKANQENWCIRFFCTTCVNQEFRNALKEISGPLGGELIRALKEIEPRHLMDLENWKGAISIAICDLPFLEQREKVLKEWLSISKINLHFTDYVFFKIVNLLPRNNETRLEWIQKCLEIALETRDFSLTESLILVLQDEATKYPQLLEIAHEYARTSSQMKRVLVNTNNII